jgi:hypothetical protein
VNKLGIKHEVDFSKDDEVYDMPFHSFRSNSDDDMHISNFKVKSRNTVTKTLLYTHNIKLIVEMIEYGFQPDESTLHAFLVEEDQFEYVSCKRKIKQDEFAKVVHKLIDLFQEKKISITKNHTFFMSMAIIKGLNFKVSIGNLERTCKTLIRSFMEEQEIIKLIETFEREMSDLFQYLHFIHLVFPECWSDACSEKLLKVRRIESYLDWFGSVVTRNLLDFAFWRKAMNSEIHRGDPHYRALSFFEINLNTRSQWKHLLSIKDEVTSVLGLALAPQLCNLVADFI